MHDFHLLNNSLIIGALLFALGAVGFVCRRNIVVMMLAIGMMLQGVMLTLTASGAFHGDVIGEVFSLFLLVVATLQGALTLAVFAVAKPPLRSLDVSGLDDGENGPADTQPAPAPGQTEHIVASPLSAFETSPAAPAETPHE